MIELELHEHIESAGCHVDRFDAYLDGDLIVTSRQPIFAGARALVGRGVDPATPMCGRWHRTGTRTMFGTVGEFAKWTVHETRDGLKRTPYVALDAAAFGFRRGQERATAPSEVGGCQPGLTSAAGGADSGCAGEA